MQDSKLHVAVRKDRLNSSINLISIGTSVNERNRNKETPLHFAARYASLDITYALLASGSSVFAKNSNGEKPLHVAAKRGNSDIVRLLAKYDRNHKAKDKDGFTPPDLAKRYGHSDTRALFEGEKLGKSSFHFPVDRDPVKFLEKYSWKYNTLKYINGQTPLHMAAALGLIGIETVETLIERSSDINATDVCDSTPLHLACMSGMEVKFSRDDSFMHVYLIRTQWWRLTRSRKFDLKERYIEVVKLLLDRGAIVNARDDAQRIPLHYAIASGSPQIVKMLLDWNSDVNWAAEFGPTPLQVASNVITPGKLDIAPFHEAIMEIVKLLLDHGANVNARYSDGNTPLHYAATRGLIGVIRLLEDSGANLHARNGDKDTFLHCAAAHDHNEIVEHYFEKFYFKSDDSAHCMNVDSKTLKETAGTLEISVEINKRRSKFLNTWNMVQFLQESDTSVKPKVDCTRKDVVDLLLENNAIQHMIFHHGCTALHIVSECMRTHTVCRRLKTLLQSAEFNVNALNFESQTPLHVLSNHCQFN